MDVEPLARVRKMLAKHGSPTGEKTIKMKSTEPLWVKDVIQPYVLSIPPYVPGKPVAEVQRELGIGKAIKLASNENALGPSPMALASLRRRMRDLSIYPESSAPDLRSRIAEKYSVEPGNVILGNGSDEIMQMLAHVFLGVKDEAIIAENSFSMYRIVTKLFGAKPVFVPLKNYHLDLEATLKAVNDRTRIIFLASPNSPTGTVITNRQIDDFLRAIKDRKLVVVFDEAYAEYVNRQDAASGLDCLEKHPGLIVLRTFSKIYGLAGLRVGYGLAQSWLIELLNRVRAPFNVNLAAQEAALAALTDREHLERSLRMNTEGMAYISDQLKSLGYEVIESQANFITFSPDIDAGFIYEELLKRGIIVRRLASFGMPGHIRVTIGTQSQNRAFITRLRQVIKGKRR